MAYEQKDLFGNWVRDVDVNPSDAQRAFDVCPFCGNNPCTCDEGCSQDDDSDIKGESFLE